MADEVTAVHTAGIENPRGRALQEYEKAIEAGDLKKYPTNVPYIDRLFGGGIPKKSVITVGGQTNVGKTALIYDGWIDKQAIANPKFTALMFNCEMDNATMMARSIAHLMYEAGYDITFDQVCEGEQAQAGIELYKEKIGDRIELYDNVRSHGEIMNIIKKNVEYNQAHGLDTPYIVIDYIQKFKESKANKSDFEAINATLDWLTHIAKTFKTVVIALTAMNRSANNDKKGDTNMLNGASGSGDIEYSADFFMYITKNSETDRKLELLKARRTKTDRPEHIIFDGEHMAFYDENENKAKGNLITMKGRKPFGKSKKVQDESGNLFEGEALNRTGQKVANDLTGRKK
jgi:replicative DNA helicase